MVIDKTKKAFRDQRKKGTANLEEFVSNQSKHGLEMLGSFDKENDEDNDNEFDSFISSEDTTDNDNDDDEDKFNKSFSRDQKTSSRSKRRRTVTSTLWRKRKPSSCGSSTSM